MVFQLLQNHLIRKNWEITIRNSNTSLGPLYSLSFRTGEEGSGGFCFCLINLVVVLSALLTKISVIISYGGLLLIHQGLFFRFSCNMVVLHYIELFSV